MNQWKLTVYLTVAALFFGICSESEARCRLFGRRHVKRTCAPYAPAPAPTCCAPIAGSCPPTMVTNAYCAKFGPYGQVGNGLCLYYGVRTTISNGVCTFHSESAPMYLACNINLNEPCPANCVATGSFYIGGHGRNGCDEGYDGPSPPLAVTNPDPNRVRVSEAGCFNFNGIRLCLYRMQVRTGNRWRPLLVGFEIAEADAGGFEFRDAREARATLEMSGNKCGEAKFGNEKFLVLLRRDNAP